MPDRQVDYSECFQRSAGPCITRKGVIESCPEYQNRKQPFDCPACDHSIEDSGSDDESSSDDDGDAGVQGGRRRRRRRRGRGQWGDDETGDDSGSDDEGGAVGAEGGRRRGHGRGRGRGDAEDGGRSRYRPWTFYIITTYILEKMAGLAAFFLYMYTDSYRWGLVKSLFFFTAGVKSINKVAHAVKKECNTRQRRADIDKFYEKK